jgi:hypothetical protein
LGGAYRFCQPIDILAKRMLWVNYFKPLTVRAIAVIEVLCVTGMLLALLLYDFTIPFLLYSGCLLMLTMLGAAIAHVIIGDYKQIVGNMFILLIIYQATFPVF